MIAVLKRELWAYFQSPLGYVFVGAYFFFSGYCFFTYNLCGNTTDMSRLYSMLFSVSLFLVPVLTMRLMSEDKRSGIDQTLFTMPVTRTGIVLGKYLAALLVFASAASSTLLQAFVMSFVASPDWPVIAGNVAGLILLGAALIAVCLFFSALTENQIIAAVCGFVTGLFLMLADTLATVIQNSFLKKVLQGISFNRRYIPFTLGIVEFSDLVFFFSVSGLFLCLVVAVLDRKRWC